MVKYYNEKIQSFAKLKNSWYDVVLEANIAAIKAKWDMEAVSFPIAGVLNAIVWGTFLTVIYFRQETSNFTIPFTIGFGSVGYLAYHFVPYYRLKSAKLKHYKELAARYQELDRQANLEIEKAIQEGFRWPVS
jgi:hypothetical protein